MARAHSGSTQQLSVAGQRLDGPGTGFSGLTVGVEPETYDVTSGGLSTAHTAGHRTATASFEVLETAGSQRLIGMHGTRQAFIWHPTETASGRGFDAILSVDHVMEDRGARRLAVSLEIDGDI